MNNEMASSMEERCHCCMSLWRRSVLSASCVSRFRAAACERAARLGWGLCGEAALMSRAPASVTGRRLP